MKTGELLAHMSNIEVGRYFGLMERLLPFMNPENCGTMFDVMRASILASRELVRPEISRKCYYYYLLLLLKRFVKRISKRSIVLANCNHASCERKVLVYS